MADNNECPCIFATAFDKVWDIEQLKEDRENNIQRYYCPVPGCIYDIPEKERGDEIICNTSPI